ncbi:hypothetical protein Pmani_035043 [Petrolisthes manimaculis]|uniref:Uncharacterized protein n=1 Tax=Petrolisthes manimaculis TaxID=1843537 RepID=A0AAE1NMH1_9EUCA|nr:hypothetical protein Pmani_035043 [Petrolisthes manimaculis]
MKGGGGREDRDGVAEITRFPGSPPAGPLPLIGSLDDGVGSGRRVGYGRSGIGYCNSLGIREVVVVLELWAIGNGRRVLVMVIKALVTITVLVWL